MNKKLLLPLIFGWYFLMQAPFDDSGALITSRVGTFASEAQCKAAYDSMKDMADKLELRVKFKKCAFVQES